MATESILDQLHPKLQGYVIDHSIPLEPSFIQRVEMSAKKIAELWKASQTMRSYDLPTFFRSLEEERQKELDANTRFGMERNWMAWDIIGGLDLIWGELNPGVRATSSEGEEKNIRLSENLYKPLDINPEAIRTINAGTILELLENINNYHPEIYVTDFYESLMDYCASSGGNIQLTYPKGANKRQYWRNFEGVTVKSSQTDQILNMLLRAEPSLKEANSLNKQFLLYMAYENGWSDRDLELVFNARDQLEIKKQISFNTDMVLDYLEELESTFNVGLDSRVRANVMTEEGRRRNRSNRFEMYRNSGLQRAANPRGRFREERDLVRTRVSAKVGMTNIGKALDPTYLDKYFPAPSDDAVTSILESKAGIDPGDLPRGKVYKRNFPRAFGQFDALDQNYPIDELNRMHNGMHTISRLVDYLINTYDSVTRFSYPPEEFREITEKLLTGVERTLDMVPWVYEYAFGKLNEERYKDKSTASADSIMKYIEERSDLMSYQYDRKGDRFGEMYGRKPEAKPTLKTVRIASSSGFRGLRHFYTESFMLPSGVEIQSSSSGSPEGETVTRYFYASGSTTVYPNIGRRIAPENIRVFTDKGEEYQQGSFSITPQGHGVEISIVGNMTANIVVKYQESGAENKWHVGQSSVHNSLSPEKSERAEKTLLRLKSSNNKIAAELLKIREEFESIGGGTEQLNDEQANYLVDRLHMVIDRHTRYNENKEFKADDPLHIIFAENQNKPIDMNCDDTAAAIAELLPVFGIWGGIEYGHDTNLSVSALPRGRFDYVAKVGHARNLILLPSGRISVRDFTSPIRLGTSMRGLMSLMANTWKRPDITSDALLGISASKYNVRDRVAETYNHAQPTAATTVSSNSIGEVMDTNQYIVGLAEQLPALLGEDQKLDIEHLLNIEIANSDNLSYIEKHYNYYDLLLSLLSEEDRLRAEWGVTKEALMDSNIESFDKHALAQRADKIVALLRFIHAGRLHLGIRVEDII